MKNIRKKTSTRKRTIVNIRGGGFNSFGTTPRRGAAPREVQKH
jgi:hypothetical protein